MSFRLQPRRRRQGYKTGLLYTGQAQYGGAQALSLNELKVIAWALDSPLAYDQVQFEVTTAAGAGGKLRVGWWWTDPETGLPGALGAELGNIDTTTTGVKTIAVPGVLPAAEIWLGGVAQIATCSVIGCSVQNAGPVAIPSTGIQQNPGGLGVGWGAGAALAAWPASGYYAAPGATRLYFRKS